MGWSHYMPCNSCENLKPVKVLDCGSLVLDVVIEGFVGCDGNRNVDGNADGDALYEALFILGQLAHDFSK
jgi:hypothetical protein